MYRGKSNIQGYGLFSKQSFKKGQLIGLLSTKYPTHYQDSHLGRYINHSYNYNVDIKRIQYKIYGVANRDIPANTELTANYLDPEAPKPNFLYLQNQHL